MPIAEYVKSLFASPAKSEPDPFELAALAVAATFEAKRAHLEDLRDVARVVGASAPSHDTVRVLRLVRDMIARVPA